MAKGKGKKKTSRKQKFAAKGDANATDDQQQQCLHEGGGEEPFNRLSDQLIISQIFDRLKEVKCLFMCFLVSKRFASLVLRTHNVSFIIPYLNDSPSPSLRQRFRNPNLRNPLKNPPSICLDEKFLSSMFSGFLENFTSVHSLHGEVSFPRYCPNLDDMWVKWLFDYKYPNSWSFAALIARKLTAATGTHSADSSNSRANTRAAMISHQASFDFLMNFVLGDVALRCHLLKAVLRSHRCFPNLNIAVISDSRKQGRLVVREEKLVAMRTQYENAQNIDGRVNGWNKAAVMLPMSRCVLKNAQLTVMNFKFAGEDKLLAKPEEDILEFQGEEDMKVFVEAVTQMMKDDADYERPFTLNSNSREGFAGTLL